MQQMRVSIGSLMMLYSPDVDQTMADSIVEVAKWRSGHGVNPLGSPGGTPQVLAEALSSLAEAWRSSHAMADLGTIRSLASRGAEFPPDQPRFRAVPPGFDPVSPPCEGRRVRSPTRGHMG